MIPADNASPRTSRKHTTFGAEFAFQLTAHPLYSPNLVPSDFFLFGHVKHCLQGRISRSREELLDAIREMVTAIPPEILQDAFEYWMER
jgi:hypothetical protein